MKKLILILALLANVADAQLVIAPNEATAARRRIPVYLVDVTDGVTPETGISLSGAECRISKAGGAAANCAGTYTHLEAGLGYYEATAGEVDTVGALTVHVVDTAARPFVAFAQVGFSPDVFAPTGTAQACTSPTCSSKQFKLASGASSTNNIYKYNLVVITSGTGGGQTRRITSYDGTSKIATVNRTWATQPDATSTYALIAADVAAANLEPITQ